MEPLSAALRATSAVTETPKATPAARAGGASFAAEVEKATAKAEKVAAKDARVAEKDAAKDARVAEKDAAKDAKVAEKDVKADAKAATRFQHVEGHRYAKAMSGEHEGRYVNRSDNARKGEFFSIVRRDDRVWHVYGEGAERQLFEVGRAAAAAKTATPKIT